MTSFILLSLVLIFAVSVLGGLVPLAIRLTHRRMQIALSFVAGIMVGVSLFDLLPGALEGSMHAGEDVHEALLPVTCWIVAGFLSIFLLERFICFHHHTVPGDDQEPGHVHATTWMGALIGLTIHSLLAGIALGVTATQGSENESIWGTAALGILLAIVFHKPFDALALGTLLAADGRPRSVRHWMNLGFALITPVGVILGWVGLGGLDVDFTSAVLAFSIGMFLCIALSDLLPELQFHHHDRILLTVVLLLGLLVGWGSSRVGGDHGHGAIHEHEHELEHEHEHEHDEARLPDPLERMHFSTESGIVG